MRYVFLGDRHKSAAFTSAALIFGPDTSSVELVLQGSGWSCDSMGEAAARLLSEGRAR